MNTFLHRLHSDIERWTAKAAALPPLNRRNAAMWEKFFLKYEEITARFLHISSYIGCLSACDARNEKYARAESDIAILGAGVAKLEIELFRAIRKASKTVFESFTARKGFKGARHFLNKMLIEARHSMAPELERLAEDLGVDGIEAWGRLYDSISGKLEFDMEFPDGKKERLPISMRRSLLDNPDRRIRRAAFEGGNAAWQSVETVAASALNAISGTRLTLNKNRGIKHFLEVALFQSSITRKTLDAMMQAIYENLELPRRILRLKAKMMGTRGVAWYDLGAPIPLAEQEELSWKKGRALVKDSFSRAYPALGDFIQKTFERKWIEWETREGKRPGAFCTSSLLTNESRVYMTFSGTMGDARTLAHEVGHAFHSHVMKGLRPFAHNYPMTLAETASTFAEMIFTDGMLKDPATSAEMKKFILDQELGHASIYLMDIPVRFEFEKALYEERAEGEISISRLKEMMTETQRRIFGDTLEPGGEDPMFWASKLHFYITEVTFYNFPYTFGFLLSRGLYHLFKTEGAAFLPRYEKFLELSGSDTCENVARASIGRDIETPQFWREAISSLEEPLKQLEDII